MSFHSQGQNVYIDKDSKKIIELTKLVESQKNVLENANHVINLQTRQLEQANDLIAIYYAILALSLVFFSLLVYFQFILPIRNQKGEIEEINRQSKTILNNIDGALKDIIEKKYNAYQNERLRRVLLIIAEDNHQQANTSIQVLSELQTTGFSEDQLQILKDYLLNIKNISIGKPYNSTIAEGLRIIIDSLIGIGRLDWVEEIFENYFNSIGGHISFYSPMYNKFSEYLSKNMKAEDSGMALKMITNIHPHFDTTERKLSEMTKIFQNWLYALIFAQPVVAAKILNDQYFVNELERLGVLNNIVNEYQKSNQLQPAFGTRTEVFGKTYFLKKLEKIKKNI